MLEKFGLVSVISIENDFEGKFDYMSLMR